MYIYIYIAGGEQLHCNQPINPVTPQGHLTMSCGTLKEFRFCPDRLQVSGGDLAEVSWVSKNARPMFGRPT